MIRRLAPLLIGAFALAGCGKSDQSQQPKTDDAAQKSAAMAHEHAGDKPVASAATLPPPKVPVKSQTVSYGSVNGQELKGYLAYPADAEGGLPGVLVFHEWWGLNDNIRAMANQLAGEGYVALAADLYRGKSATAPDQAEKLMDEALKDKAALSTNLRQAHSYMREQLKATRVATLGWCFGGGMSFETSLLVPDQVDATVIYYGFISTDPEDLKKVRAPILGLFGGADQSIPLETVKKFESTLKSLGKSVEIHVYDGAGHAFANPSGQNYKADAAADAWQRTLAFLSAHLKSDTPAPAGE